MENNAKPKVKKTSSAVSAARRRERLRRQRRKRMIRNSLIIAAALIAITVIIVFATRPDDTELPPDIIATAIPTATAYSEPANEQTATATPEPTQTPVPTFTPVPTPTPEPTPAPPPVKLEYDYFIELDKGRQIVTVYTLGETGYYDLIVKQFICSTGSNDKISDGMYRIQEQYRWKQMGNGSYAQYASRISGPFLFHSCVYYKETINSLKQYYYNNLGRNVSSGCVRLTCGDAYWIFTHCPKGTPIRVYDSGTKDPALLETLWHPALININYDPTDPNCPTKYAVTPSPDATPDPTPAYGVTPAPTPKWTVHPTLKAWGY